MNSAVADCHNIRKFLRYGNNGYLFFSTVTTLIFILSLTLTKSFHCIIYISGFVIFLVRELS